MVQITLFSLRLGEFVLAISSYSLNLSSSIRLSFYNTFSTVLLWSTLLKYTGFQLFSRSIQLSPLYFCQLRSEGGESISPRRYIFSLRSKLYILSILASYLTLSVKDVNLLRVNRTLLMKFDRFLFYSVCTPVLWTLIRLVCTEMEVMLNLFQVSSSNQLFYSYQNQISLQNSILWIYSKSSLLDTKEIRFQEWINLFTISTKVLKLLIFSKKVQASVLNSQRKLFERIQTRS